MTSWPATPRSRRALAWLCGALIVSYVVVTSVVLLLGGGGGAAWLVPGVLALTAVGLLVLVAARELRARADDHSRLRARFDAHACVHDRFLALLERVDEENMLPELPERPADPAAQQEFDRYFDAMVRVRELYQAQRSAVHASVVSLARKVQTTAHRVQEEAGRMVARHPSDADVLETGMRIDHAAAQQARYAQSVSTLCGEWPGQQWHEPLALADVVRAGAGRITAYQRVELSGDPAVAVSSRVVEPLIHLVAELLANGAQSSPPTTNVLVTLRHVQRGAVIEVDDCGVGMDDRRLENARLVVSGHKVIDLYRLGELPQTGFAAVGTYVRRYGFRVDLAQSVYGGVRATVLVPSELTEALPPDGSVGGGRLPLARQTSSATMPAMAVPPGPPIPQAPQPPDAARTPRTETRPEATARPEDTAPPEDTARPVDRVPPEDRVPPVDTEAPEERVPPEATAGRAHDDERSGSTATSTELPPEVGGTPNHTPLPRRRSRRGEAASSAAPPRPKQTRQATQPTAEQAGQWMGAFLNTDAERGGAHGARGPASRSEAYDDPRSDAYDKSEE